MTELAAAASVAGLISLTIQIAQFTYEPVKGVLKYSREFEAFTTQVKKLSRVLSEIKPLLERLDNDGKATTGLRSLYSVLTS